MEKTTEWKQVLSQLDASSCFLLLIIASTLLSYRSLGLQRRQLCALLAGEDPSSLPSLFPLRLLASALVIGALGFFLSLSLNTLGQAEAAGEVAPCRSARLNALASALVLGAALLRLDDLLTTEVQNRALLLEDDLPA